MSTHAAPKIIEVSDKESESVNEMPAVGYLHSTPYEGIIFKKFRRPDPVYIRGHVILNLTN